MCVIDRLILHINWFEQVCEGLCCEICFTTYVVPFVMLHSNMIWSQAELLIVNKSIQIHAMRTWHTVEKNIKPHNYVKVFKPLAQWQGADISTHAHTHKHTQRHTHTQTHPHLNNLLCPHKYKCTKDINTVNVIRCWGSVRHTSA